MDIFNRSLAQLGELFRTITIGARITAGLLFVLVAVSLVYLFRYQTSSPDLYLMNGERFSANELAAMEAAFASGNLSSYEIDGNRVRVPRGQKALYMAALADKKAVPSGFLRYLDEAVNAQGSFLEDRHQREERIKVAKQKELSQIISGMSGIESASVMWDAETMPGLVPETAKTALASVKPAGSVHLDEAQAANIRHLVAAAVAGLKYENVKVLDESNGRTFHGGADGDASPMDDPYYARKRHAEQQWRDKILSALSMVPGVTVQVNVELREELRRRETEIKPDQKTVAAKTIEKTRTRTQEGAVPQGRVGLTANQPQAVGPTSARGSRDEEEETTSTNENVIGSTAKQTDYPGLTPSRVAASIGVPTGYFERVWRERNPTSPGEEPKKPTQADLEQVRTQEIAKIQSAVTALLPAPPAGSDVKQLVTVTEFQDITTEPVPAPGLPVQLLDWLVNNWTMLGLILVAMFSLVVLRSVVRSAPAATPRPLPVAVSGPAVSPAAGPAPIAAAAPQEPQSQESARERRLRRLVAGGPSLRDELSELISEDPDTAANILRAWIGTAK